MVPELHGRMVARAALQWPGMSQAEHKARAPVSVRCFIVTVSDTRTEETDTSGRAIADLLTAGGHNVAGRTIVKDDPDLVRLTRELRALLAAPTPPADNLLDTLRFIGERDARTKRLR